MEKGIVLDIQRMSTEDGPGLRTTAFLKGCNLSCEWCHNPESISKLPAVLWHKTKCIGCLSCIDVCKQGAISGGASGISIDNSRCIGCFICAEECPGAALVLKGTCYSVEQLFSELIKDREYYESAGGGVTLSGGEALLQRDFALALLKRLKQAGINTAVDTAGCLDYPTIAEAAKYTDIFLYDLKIADAASHKAHTGASNTLILENLKKLVNTAKEIWIRTPIIPDATDSEENIAAIARFIESLNTNTITRWELCAFNNLCISKYEMLDLEWKYKGAPLIETAKIERLADLAKRELTNKNIVYVKGMTK